MYSEITTKLLEAAAQVESMRAELNEKKKLNKKETMKPLNYRFPSSIKSGCEDMAEKCEMSDLKWNESDVARSALYLGLQQLNEVFERDEKKLNGLMHVIKMRLALGK